MESQIVAWSPFLSGLKWSYFATFTTRRPISLKSARRLAERVGSRVLRDSELMFWVAESFPLGREGYHLHALIQSRLSHTQIAKWYDAKYGRCELKKYDPKRGAVAYVAKYFLKTMPIEYDVFRGGAVPELFKFEGKSKIPLDKTAK